MLSLVLKRDETMSQYISGVSVILIPFIPDQSSGQTEYFDKIEMTGRFNQEGELNLDIDISPEFSYLVSGSYESRFGRLKSSRNTSLSGEIERMMKKVGCFIINNQWFEKDEANSVTFENSAIDCAESCSRNQDSCHLGWSYQMGTRKCLFMRNVTEQDFKPNMNTTKTEFNVGWISGHKSCSEPGDLINIYLYLFHPFC